MIIYLAFGAWTCWRHDTGFRIAMVQQLWMLDLNTKRAHQIIFNWRHRTGNMQAPPSQPSIPKSALPTTQLARLATAQAMIKVSCKQSPCTCARVDPPKPWSIDTLEWRELMRNWFYWRLLDFLKVWIVVVNLTKFKTPLRQLQWPIIFVIRIRSIVHELCSLWVPNAKATDRHFILWWNDRYCLLCKLSQHIPSVSAWNPPKIYHRPQSRITMAQSHHVSHTVDAYALARLNGLGNEKKG